MARITGTAVAAFVLLALSNIGNAPAHAFITPSLSSFSKNVDHTTTSLRVTAEESAKALSDYMAKAHEEKLRAVKDAEERKAAEIQALKKELAELKAAQGSSIVLAPAASSPPVEGSVEELQAKLASYQKFLSEYIVNAQEQKLLAVKAAEKSVEMKFSEKLKLLTGDVATPPPAATAAVVTTKNSFEARNANVAAAGKAGKSRWGDLEVLRASGNNVAAVPPPAVTAPATPAKVPVKADTSGPVPPEVEAADHGLRADGGVAGPTLAERVAGGSLAFPANGASSTTPLALPREATLYNLRNAHVAAAAAAGKSRWGEKEVQKATEHASRPAFEAFESFNTFITPAIEAADHGLRADGSVGGPSLAERVNLGARLLQNA